LNEHLGFDAATIDCLVLSHAHIDHSGLIPKLVKEGFRGSIYCTPATKELSAILLEDSATIQRDDTRFINKRRAKQGLPPYEPLYDLEDAALAITLAKAVNYDTWTNIYPDVE
ncbi:MBL fold metallo-hydrolase, partial [Staphylococcus aureus]